MTFNFSFEGSVEMSAEEIWPDGGGPDDPTVEDVIKEVNSSSSLLSLLSDWQLEDYLELYVNGERALN